MKAVKIIGIGFGCAVIVGALGFVAVMKAVVDAINGDIEPHHDREWPFR